MLFDAYPGEREELAGKALRELASSTGGRMLPSTVALRVWGEILPRRSLASRASILSNRAFVPITEVPAFLESRPEKAIHDAVARSGKVLLLAFDPGEVSLTR